MKTITIAGNIGKSAVTRTTQGGDSVTGWSVAVEERNGQDKRTIWFDCLHRRVAAQALQGICERRWASHLDGKGGLLMKTPQKLAEILDYYPDTGMLIWMPRGPESFSCADNERSRVASRWNKKRAGQPAGIIRSTGYRTICIEGVTYQASRIAWAIYYGQWPQGQIDHINHSRDDNRIANLRDVSSSENSRNRSLPNSSTSGAIGVHYHKPSGKWHARVWAGGTRRHLGSFNSKQGAIAARQAASAEFGFHQNHGEIQ